MELLWPLVFVVVAFYLILLRPVLNQQRRRRRDLSKLAVGDEVLTSSGFFAGVRAIRTREDGLMEIMLELAPGVEVRATPEAIQVITASAADAAATDGALDAADETDAR